MDKLHNFTVEERRAIHLQDSTTLSLLIEKRQRRTDFLNDRKRGLLKEAKSLINSEHREFIQNIFSMLEKMIQDDMLIRREMRSLIHKWTNSQLYSTTQQEQSTPNT